MTVHPSLVAVMLAAAAPSLVQISLVQVSLAQVTLAQVTPPSTAIDPGVTAPQPGQRPPLSAEQKSMIFRTVHQDRTKVAKRDFPAQVGAEVPPSLELYSLPDDAIMQAPVVKLFRVVVLGDKVVLVDPTTMRVVDVIDR